MNPLVPLGILFLLPLTVIGLILFTDAGIEPSLIYATVKSAVVLVVIGGAISFAASRLAERSHH